LKNITLLLDNEIRHFLA